MTQPEDENTGKNTLSYLDTQGSLSDYLTYLTPTTFPLPANEAEKVISLYDQAFTAATEDKLVVNSPETLYSTGQTLVAIGNEIAHKVTGLGDYQAQIMDLRAQVVEFFPQIEPMPDPTVMDQPKR